VENSFSFERKRGGEGKGMFLGRKEISQPQRGEKGEMLTFQKKTWSQSDLFAATKHSSTKRGEG